MNLIDKKFGIYTAWHLLALCLAFLFGLFCYFYQIKYPPCCDADQYIDLAKHFSLNGISPLNWNDAVRPYGYPFFISILIKLNFLGLPLSFLLFLAQIFIYFFASILLSKYIYINFSKNFSYVVFFGLICNLFIYPFFGIPLTDGFAISILILLFYVALKLYVNKKLPKNISIGYYLALGFLLGYLIEIRPGNIFLIAPTFLFLYFQIRRKLDINSILILLFFCSGFLISVAPEIYLNMKSFSRLSFMPVEKQDDFFNAGFKLLKCQTNLSGGFGLMCSKNPLFLTGATMHQWILENPLGPIKTLFIHLYGSLDFNYLFPYVYKMNISYRPFLFLSSQIIVFYGFVGLISNFFAAIRSPFYKNKEIIFIIWTLIFGWACIYSLIPNDPRYSFPILLVLIPSAIWTLFRIYISHYSKFFHLCFSVYLVLSYKLSAFIEAYKTLIPSFTNF